MRNPSRALALLAIFALNPLSAAHAVTDGPGENTNCSRILESRFKVEWLNEAIAQAHETGDERKLTEHLLELAALEPTNSQVHNQLARIFKDRNKNSEALKHAQKAFEIKAKLGRNVKSELELVTLLAVKLKKWDVAIASSSEATQRYPRHKKFLGLKTRSLLELGRYEEALQTANLQLTLEADNLAALGLKTQALLKLRRFAEALKVAEEQVALNPKSSVAIVLKIQALVGLRRLQEALQLNQQLIDWEPNNVINYRLRTKLLRLMSQ